MSDIFISYAREDRPRAEAIAKALEAHGWSVWWDRNIRVGETFRRVIREEIKKARSVVVLWSEQSVDSDWVNEEASIGKRRNILVPVLTDDVELPLGFGSIQTADLTGWGGDAAAPAFQMLCSALQALIGPYQKAEPVATPPPAPAAVAVEEGPAWEPVPDKVTPAQVSKTQVRGVTGPAAEEQSTSTARRQSGPWTNPKDGLSYVRIEPGEFWMGATPGDTEAGADEKPRHRVRITKGLWLGATPVTVAAYKRFVGERSQFKIPDAPSFNSDWSKPDHPIVRVTWDEAKAYCEWAGGRLPTEAEWEYAARGGKDGLKYPWGNEITPENANYRGSKWGGTSPVRSYPANAWGVYDVAGNVWQWVADWYDKDYYASSPSDDPHGPQSGAVRVLRGGSFNYASWVLRAASRLRVVPGVRVDFIGFRCVREVVP